jgi:hypothetical protein
MKRIIAAALLAALTVPAFAFETGAPFEQTQLDRQLPNVKDPVVADQASSGGTLFGLREDAPYEQYRIDTALPNVKDPVVTPRTQFAGPTSAYGSSEATGAFADDSNFIAPPQ